MMEGVEETTLMQEGEVRMECCEVEVGAEGRKGKGEWEWGRMDERRSERGLTVPERARNRK